MSGTFQGRVSFASIRYTDILIAVKPAN